MKKFLSLVLALVMTMSLVTVSAGAAEYKDAADINNVEAVDVLSALGILTGDQAGFRPQDTLKRSEAAKIICCMNLGADTASKLSADTAPFADVAKSHWAAGYIAECVEAGIIGGVGNNKFNPDGKLTGFAFAKMLLVSLGYDAAKAGLTGANWTVNVAKLIDEKELDNGIEKFVGKDEITREDAAQMVLNTLEAAWVEYDEDGTNITIGDIVISTSTKVSDNTAGTGDAAEPLYEKLYDGDLVRTEDATTVDDLGRLGVNWEYDDEEIGTYGEAADYVLVAKKATDLETLIEDNDLEKKIASGYTNWTLTAGQVVELWVTSKAVTHQIWYQYDLVEVTDVNEYDEEEEMAEDYGASVSYSLSVLAGTVTLGDTYVDALSESKSGYVAIGDFEEDDILLVTVNDADEAVEFVKAEVAEGELTARGTDYIKLDGVKYTSVAGLSAALTFEDIYTVWLDANNIALDWELKQEADSTLEYVYVMNADAQDEGDGLFDNDKAGAKVEVMYLDGTTEVLDYAIDTKDEEFKFMGATVTYTSGTAGSELTDVFAVTSGWYAYTLNSDGEVTLKTAVKADKSDIKNVSIVEDGRTVATGIYANSTTVVTVLNEDGVVKSYKGYKNFPSSALTGANELVIFGSSATSAKEVYVYDAAAVEDVESIDVAILVAKGDQTKDGQLIDFYVEGEKATYTVDTANSDTLTVGKLYEIDIDEDDIATVTLLVNAAPPAAPVFAKGNSDHVADDFVVIAGVEYAMTEDCAVYQVSMDGKVVSSATLKKDKNVVAILNTDGEATEIYIYKDITLAN